MKRTKRLLATLLFTFAGLSIYPFYNLHAQTNFVKYRAGEPILPLGSSGEWDDTEAGYAQVIFDGEQYRMWYSGSPQANNYLIGYAISSDGINWTKYEDNPVFSPDGSGFDSQDVWIPYVLFNGSQYEMWYVGNAGSGDIGYALSDDGISWARQNNGSAVLTDGSSGTWDQNAIWKPVVLRNDTLYQMWYAGTSQSATGIWHTGYATSMDGISWSKHPDNPVLTAGNQGDWDAGGAILSGIIFDAGLYHAWYNNWSSSLNGLKTGYATSTDGLDWTKHADNPVLVNGDWDNLNSAFPTVIKDGHRWRMWYTSRRTGSIDRLSYAEDFSNAAHVDSVRVSSENVVSGSRINFNIYIANPHNENLTARALIKSNNGSVIASVDLEEYEGSGIWPGHWAIPEETADYSIGVEITNITAGYMHNSFDWGVYD